MQDLRLAVRALRATPVVTAVAILSLALGIGANTAIFSLVSSLLLRSLPVVDPQRLAIVATSTSLNSRPQYSYATFDQIRQHRDIFDGALGYTDCCGTAILNLAAVAKVWLHSTGDASPLAALLLAQILPVFSVVAPCHRGASPVSVRRQTFTTGC